MEESRSISSSSLCELELFNWAAQQSEGNVQGCSPDVVQSNIPSTMAGKEVSCPSSYGVSEQYAPLDFIKDLEEARDKGMDHFAHDHPLEFKELRMKNEEGTEHKKIICHACGLEIEGCGFSCSVGNLCRKGFHLHQICAFLPKELPNYPNHDSQHTLILYQKDSFLSTNHNKCSLCYKGIKRWNFFYSCNICRIFIDVRCASKRILVCGNTHHHPLTPKLYPALFECSLCRQKLENLGIHYECNTCTFIVHEECYSPPPIKHASHAHPLHVSFSHMHPHPMGTLFHQCYLCKKSEFGKKIMMYSCAKCNYYIHLHCSLKKWEEKPIQISEVKGELIEFPMPTSQSIEGLLSYFIKQKCEWKVGAAEDITEPLLKHACHHHPLIFNDSNNLVVSDRSCNVCSLFVSDSSFYSCTQLSCNFVLHKWCAKLPLEMQHPTHPGHTLLLQERHVESFGFFFCNGCRQLGNGFVYKCSKHTCSFSLDVICACFPSYVKHETHQHPLHIGVSTNDRSCTSCGGDITSQLSYGCDACTFSIDICCLLLPQEIKHWYDREHEFKLTYAPPVCEQGYYCEFCEEEIDPNQWNYHCFECDWSLHTNCVRKAFNLFKGSMVLGESQFYPLHIHPLTCVLVPREWHTFCSKCSRNNYETFGHEFSCTECKIVFCFSCVLDDLSSRVEIVPEMDIEIDGD